MFNRLSIRSNRAGSLSIGNPGRSKTGRWIKKQIRENLDGFVGRLDTLVPKLTMEDKIYGEHRLSENMKSKDVGALGVPGDWQIQFWVEQWNSKQLAWRLHPERHPVAGSERLAKLKMYVDYILPQDEDGYLGIYDKDLRYKFDNENGSSGQSYGAARTSGVVWIFKWSKVLTAIERAIQNVMDNYPRR